MNKAIKIFAPVAGLALLLGIFINCIDFWGFNRDFYKGEYAKLETADYIGITEDELTQATEVLLDYLTDERDDLNVTAVIDGEQRQVFNEKEVAHMVDVKNLYLGAMTFSLICFGIFVAICGVIIYVKRKETVRVLAKGFIHANFLFLGILGVLGLWAVFDFNSFWTSFHHVFFMGNDLWILDPTTDILIMMVPSQFFFDLVMSIVVTFVVVDGILLTCSGIYVKRSKRAHT